MSAACAYKTTWGPIRVEIEQGRVISCDLPTCVETPTRDFKLGPMPSVDTWDKCDADSARAMYQFLLDLFAGRMTPPPAFQFPNGPDFHQQIWNALIRIPAGKTETYGSLAKKVKRPLAARAVGQACGANPLPLLIPCHRVVATSGQLGGFSCGLPWKKLLLARELGLS